MRMIIILLCFNGGSTGEGHDIAHIASSIFSPPCAGFFFAHSAVVYDRAAVKERLWPTILVAKGRRLCLIKLNYYRVISRKFL
ncbi:hypothetical protein EGK14_03625 [Erwinia sp. 198]|nr:hypothetical protein EGK14_03625 [Erwinia sp. 198]